MVSVGTCTGNALPGITAELIGIDISVTPVGDLFSVVSVLFTYGFKVKKVDCVSVWKPRFWFDFWASSFSVTVDRIERIPSKLWSTNPFALVSLVILFCKKSS